MTYTVFWSWQNDLPAETNKAFIRDALDAAIGQVNESLDVEDADRVELDHDTKGTPGMVDISRTILEKISGSAVMVADVTPIAKSAGGKALPNPNVMMELGYAMSAIGDKRTIPVLNTANGNAVEGLPFDIKGRQIIRYALHAKTAKAEREKAREELIEQLAGAIRVNIDAKHDARSASASIKGVESDPRSPGLWKAEWPVSHPSGGDGGEVRVKPVESPRAWLRIIPEGFPRGKPQIADLLQLPDGARLWAPPGGGNNGDFGAYQSGFVTYWIADEEDDGTSLALNLAAYLEDSGEVWMSDGTAFFQDGERKYISHEHLLSNWDRGLKNGMVCLDELGASRRRQVVLGLDGMSGAIWLVPPGSSARSRKPGLLMEKAERDWPEDRRRQLLHEARNELRNAFSLLRTPYEEFARHLESRSS